MMTMTDSIDVSDLPAYLHGPHRPLAAEAAVAAPRSAEPEVATLEEQEKLLIIRALEASGGNQSQAARLLHIGRDALRYKLKKHNL